jgi:hypothetical protein
LPANFFKCVASLTASATIVRVGFAWPFVGNTAELATKRFGTRPVEPTEELCVERNSSHAKY